MAKEATSGGQSPILVLGDMRELPRINTVLLDADGVTQTSGPNLLSSIQSLCTEADRRTDFLSEIFSAEKTCLTGKGYFPDALGEVLSRWKTETPLTEALELWAQIDPAQEILRAVGALQQTGIRVGLATNQQAHRARIMATNLDYVSVFDDLFFSYELGYAKPDPRFFTEVLDRLQVAGSQVLFIDDHPENVSSAQQVGICAEVYHVDQGISYFRTMLQRYGLDVA